LLDRESGELYYRVEGDREKVDDEKKSKKSKKSSIFDLTTGKIVLF